MNSLPPIHMLEPDCALVDTTCNNSFCTMGVTKERRRRGKRNGPGPHAGEKQSNSHHAKTKSTPHSNSPNGGAAPKPGYKPHATLLVQFTEETPTWYECGRNTAVDVTARRTPQVSGRKPHFATAKQHAHIQIKKSGYVRMC